MANKAKDITSLKIGMLTAIRRLEGRTKAGLIQWECQCDCGNLVVVTGSEFSRGRKKSCGCSTGEFISKSRMASFGTLEQRFHERYEKSEDGCWNWKANKDKDGYGILGDRDSPSRRAHRFSWELFNGKSIPEELVVRHTCDNPSCVNPKHLIIGTVQDNVRDMLYRERSMMRGENHNQAKLSWSKVADIRESDKSNLELSLEYDVSVSTIKRVRNYTSWVTK